MKRTASLVIALILFCFCGPKEKRAEKVEKIIEDGVEVIVNHLEPYKIKGEPTTFSIEEESVIDTESEDLAELGIGSIDGGDVDAESNIYFASNEQLFKFDKRGNFIQTIGQKGQGPGEYQSISGLRILNSGEISFYDFGNVKFLLFNKDGTFKDEIKKKARIFTYLGIYLDNGNCLLRERKDLPEKGSRRFHFALLDGDFRKIKSLQPSYSIEIPYLGGGYNLIGFGLGYEIVNDQIYLSSNKEEKLEVLVYNLHGELLRKIRKESKKVKVSNDYKEKRLESVRKVPAWRELGLEDKYFFPDHFPIFKSFCVDDEGRILVETYEEGERSGEYILHIFNPEGVFVGSKSLKEARSRKFKNNRMFCVYRKESGFSKLVVYKLNWE